MENSHISMWLLLLFPHSDLVFYLSYMRYHIIFSHNLKYKKEFIDAGVCLSGLSHYRIFAERNNNNRHIKTTETANWRST